MNPVIWKFPIAVLPGPQQYELPRGARVLAVGVTEGAPVFWCECDTEAEPVLRRFLVVWTGKRFDPRGWEYRGTAVIPAGLVFHLYESTETAS